jgi:hypothetical protein
MQSATPPISAISEVLFPLRSVASSRRDVALCSERIETRLYNLKAITLW